MNSLRSVYRLIKRNRLVNSLITTFDGFSSLITVNGGVARIRREAREKVSQYEHLQSIQAEIKRKYNRKFRRTVLYVEKYYIWEDRLYTFPLVLILVLLVLLALLLGLDFVILMHNGSDEITNSLTASFSHFLWVLITVGIVVILGKFYLGKAFHWLISFVFYICSLTIFYILVDQNVFQIKNTTNALFLEQGIVLGILYGIAFIIAISLFVYRDYRITNELYTKYSDHFVIYYYFELLLLLENFPNAFGTIFFTNKIIRYIEKIALIYEYGFSKKLDLRDTLTREWFKTTSIQMANGVRTLKSWAITPRGDTLEHLKQKLAENFLFALQGNWDLVEKAQEEKISTRQRLYDYSQRGLRATVLSIIPIGLFIWVQSTSYAVDKSIADPVVIGLVVWTIAIFYVSLDKNFGEKIAVLKDISLLIPPLRR